jgi:hypothetical protein
MARYRTVEELNGMVEEIEHARCVHPLRALIAKRFYIDGWVSSEGGLSLAMFNALLFVPFMMFLFFYPVYALVGLGVVLVATVVLYEGCVIWRRRHPRRQP